MAGLFLVNILFVEYKLIMVLCNICITMMWLYLGSTFSKNAETKKQVEKSQTENQASIAAKVLFDWEARTIVETHSEAKSCKNTENAGQVKEQSVVLSWMSFGFSIKQEVEFGKTYGITSRTRNKIQMYIVRQNIFDGIQLSEALASKSPKRRFIKNFVGSHIGKLTSASHLPSLIHPLLIYFWQLFFFWNCQRKKIPGK